MPVKKEETGTPGQGTPKTREEYLVFLLEHGVDRPQRYSKIEMEALYQDITNPEGNPSKPRTDPCLGLSSLAKADLAELGQLFGIKTPLAKTNGHLVLEIRHLVESLVDQKLGMGRLKKLTFRQICLTKRGYLNWAEGEMDKHPHLRLSQLEAMNRMFHR